MPIRFPLILALLGFCLLLLIEGRWLNGVYEETLEDIQDRAYQAVVEEVRQLEDSLVQHVLIGPQFNPSLAPTGSQRLTFHTDADTHALRQFQAIIVQEDGPSFSEGSEQDSSLSFRLDWRKLKLWSAQSEDDARERSGSISVFVSSADSIRVRALSGEGPSIRPLLLERVQAAITRGGLPGNYTLLNLPNDSLAQTLEVYRYHDMPSDERVSVVLNQPQRLIIQQMWPEIALAALLFLVLATAFIVVYRSLRRERQLMRLKQDFMSNMTHELKTPITTVGVAIEALRNFSGLEDPVRTAEYLDISQQELKRLGLLVDRVLRMAQFEAGQPQLQLESLDLKGLLDDVLAAMQLQFTQVKAQVSIQIQGEQFEINGDRNHLTSVLYNLLDNALKYSPDRPSIDIALRQHPGSLELSIQDQGMGIPSGYQSRVFDRFFRVPQGDRHDTKGHGLGLSYVAAVIQAHAGQLSLDSQPGHGSTFTFSLPLAHASA